MYFHSLPSYHHLSHEEAQSGLYLDGSEAVAADLPVVTRVSPQDIGNGVKVPGQIVAELRFGGAAEYTTGHVVSYMDGATRNDVLVIQSSNPDDPRVTAHALAKGEKWGIGRMYEGQANLVPTVSGDHCAVGLDKDGRLEVENHNPTNLTGLRVF